MLLLRCTDHASRSNDEGYNGKRPFDARHVASAERPLPAAEVWMLGRQVCGPAIVSIEGPRRLVAAVQRALRVGFNRRGIGRVRLERAGGRIVDPADGGRGCRGYTVLTLLGANRQRGDRAKVRTINVRRILRRDRISLI